MRLLFLFFFFALLGDARPCFGESKKIFFQSAPFTLRTVDLSKEELRLMWKDSDGRRFKNAKGLSNWGNKRSLDLAFATNAGIFEKDFAPAGLLVIDGKILRPLNSSSGKGNFFLKPNGVFSILNGVARIQRTESLSEKQEFDIATQSGPLLLIEGEHHPAFREGSQNRLIRSGVGVLSETEIVFAISDEPVNFFDFASLFKHELKCKDALYLDGVISIMYAQDVSRYQRSGDFAGLFAIFDKAG